MSVSTHYHHLLNGLQTQCQDFRAATTWLKQQDTQDHMTAFLEEYSIHTKYTRIVLGVLFMAHGDDADGNNPTFSKEEPHDVIMHRESQRLYRLFLSGDVEGEDITRATRFYTSWMGQDKSKTLRYLMDSVVLLKRRGEDPALTFELIRQIGGIESECAARRMYSREWSMVAPDQLERHVHGLIRRAFWDTMREEAEHGTYDRLWAMLTELQEAMVALVGHSDRAKRELLDKFDAVWLREMANAQALSAASVRGLMQFLATTLASWQAPADDEDSHAWVQDVERVVAEHADTPLGELVSGPFLVFLDGAFERLAAIYHRVLSMAPIPEGEEEKE